MTDITRRDTLRLGLTTAAGLALIPEWALPAFAQGEVDVPFTDFPANFVTSPADGARRTIDLRNGKSGMRLYCHTGTHLPSLPQIPRSTLPHTGSGLSPTPFGAIEIFRTNGSCLRIREPKNVIHARIDAIVLRRLLRQQPPIQKKTGQKKTGQ